MTSTLIWERVAHHSHLYVLPITGAASALLGCLSLLGVGWALSDLLPLALVAVGLSALVGSVGSYMCIPGGSRKDERTPTSHPSVAAAEDSGASGRGIVPKQVHKASTPRPHSGLGRATLAHLTLVEEELWRRWSSPQVAPLGAPLVGPVPETAYSPHRAGGFAPFPERDQDIVTAPAASGVRTGAGSTTGGGSSSSVSTSSRNPGSSTRPPLVSGRDTLAPRPRPIKSEPLSVGRSPPGPSPASPKAPGSTASGAGPLSVHRYDDTAAPRSVGTVSPLASGRVGELYDLDSFDHPAYLESINPILPRLRPASGSRSMGHPEIAPEVTHPPRTGRFCSECSRRLLDFRSWVECRVCRKPLCHPCLRESFREDEAGLCSECRDNRRWSPRGGGYAHRGRTAAIDLPST